MVRHLMSFRTNETLAERRDDVLVIISIALTLCKTPQDTDSLFRITNFDIFTELLFLRNLDF